MSENNMGRKKECAGPEKAQSACEPLPYYISCLSGFGPLPIDFVDGAYVRGWE